jgi:hypothetical protein
LLFLKYCPDEIIKCYHPMSRDKSASPHELLKLKYVYRPINLNGYAPYGL